MLCRTLFPGRAGENEGVIAPVHGVELEQVIVGLDHNAVLSGVVENQDIVDDLRLVRAFAKEDGMARPVGELKLVVRDNDLLERGWIDERSFLAPTHLGPRSNNAAGIFPLNPVSRDQQPPYPSVLPQ